MLTHAGSINKLGSSLATKDVRVQNYAKEARILLALAIPVIFAQVSHTAMVVVDTTMSGSVIATDMAAVAPPSVCRSFCSVTTCCWR